MSQTQTVGSHKTTVKQDSEALRVTYHETDVVTAYPDRIILNTGGWLTATTKTRMNQASNQYGLGYSVYQVKGQWFVDYRGVTFRLVDMIVLPR